MPSRRGARRSRQRSGTPLPASGWQPARPRGRWCAGPQVLALRRDGIAYDAVRPALTATAVEPGDKAYPRVRSTYVRTGAPGLVLQPGALERLGRGQERAGFQARRDQLRPTWTARA